MLYIILSNLTWIKVSGKPAELHTLWGSKSHNLTASHVGCGRQELRSNII